MKALFIILLFTFVIGCGDDGPTGPIPWSEFKYEVTTSISGGPATLEYLDSTGSLIILNTTIPADRTFGLQLGRRVGRSMRVTWSWSGVPGAKVKVSTYLNGRLRKSDSAFGNTGDILVADTL